MKGTWVAKRREASECGECWTLAGGYYTGTLPFAKSLLNEKYRGKALAATDVLVQVFGFGFSDYTLMTSNSGLPGV